MWTTTGFEVIFFLISQLFLATKSKLHNYLVIISRFAETGELFVLDAYNGLYMLNFAAGGKFMNFINSYFQ